MIRREEAFLRWDDEDVSGANLDDCLPAFVWVDLKRGRLPTR